MLFDHNLYRYMHPVSNLPPVDDMTPSQQGVTSSSKNSYINITHKGMMYEDSRTASLC